MTRLDARAMRATRPPRRATEHLVRPAASGGPEMIPVENTSGEEIPPFGIMPVTEWLVGRAKVGKPGTDLYAKGPPILLANGAEAIPSASPGNHGFAQPGWPAIVKYTGVTPTIGDAYGPKHGVWTAEKDYLGMRCEGIHNAEDKLAVFSRYDDTFFVVELTEALNMGSNADCKIQTAALNPTGFDDINVTDGLGTMEGIIGDRAYAKFAGGVYWFDNLQC